MKSRRSKQSVKRVSEKSKNFFLNQPNKSLLDPPGISHKDNKKLTESGREVRKLVLTDSFLDIKLLFLYSSIL